MCEEVKCKTDPRAPHGFCRNESASEGRYVCECEFWEPEEEVSKDEADKVQVGGFHYKDMGVQPWEVMEAVLTREEFIGFLKGNLIKYSMRAGKKAGVDATEDINKYNHYLQKLKEVEERAW